MSFQLVTESLNQVLNQNGHPTLTFKPETDILNDTPLDSLDLGLVIVLLEEKSGKDPFSKGFIPFRTVEELAKLYE